MERIISVRKDDCRDDRKFSQCESSSLQTRRRSRSRSPTRGHRSQWQKPPNDRPYTATHSPKPFFPSGASPQAASACAVCLGRRPHNVARCSPDTLWDGTKARCRRDRQGRIINPGGQAVCFDWQRPNGCQSNSPSHIHECSGCGKGTHGAQECPQAQKN